MPANLPPEYFEVEKTLRQARTAEEKIAIMEKLLSIIPRHKGTEKLVALYRSKIAKLKEEIERRPAAKKGQLFRIEKSGAGQVVIIGPPNAGKSALIRALTGVEVEVADFPFTTRLAAPYMMPFKNIKIQLIDTPPITADFMESWLVEMIKMGEAVLVVLDAASPESSAQLETILNRLKEKKVELVSADTTIPPERFPFMKRALLVLNKCDLGGADSLKEELTILFGRTLETVTVSALSLTGLEDLRRRIFDLLQIVRVYSKVPGKKPDYESPFILKKGSNIMDLARQVHKDFAEKLNYARVWNKPGTIAGLRVTRDYILNDEDTVELHL
ncbi:MAG: 50S ribosome-binding GTPase [Candidatus Saccharicenans sp.]|jgi:small GTP-binding protein|nr:50S ribosome-binding GTPase [Candidatus Saccharicenans sp.]MDH7492243.1 50S ribosome-binding GTPase [Candidatus Saccharicenans sp.]